MSRTFDCRDDDQREEGLRTAAATLGRGGLVVTPTDTLYGLAADAFNPGAVTALLAAKGRDRAMPPPVLVAGKDVLRALATNIPDEVNQLIDAFWPGGLTVICWANPSLAWDLGDTGGTVAVRVPDHPVALALLKTCGPLAVSSANLSGRLPAATAAQAEYQLGTDVEVYLEAGELAAGVPSTILDATGPELTVVRSGAVSLAQLCAVVPTVAGRVGAHVAGEADPSAQAGVLQDGAHHEAQPARAAEAEVDTGAEAEPAASYDARQAFADRESTRQREASHVGEAGRGSAEPGLG